MALDERPWINKKRSDWERLSAIVERTKTGGLRGLSREELPALGSLYRRAAADLAYARAQGANPNLVLYLNELVGNAHGVIYAEDSGGWARLAGFLAYGLPAVLRRRMPFILFVVGLNLLAAWLAYAIVHHDPRHFNLFMPAGLRESADAWKKGFADHGDISPGQGFAFSSMLMTHNTEVGIVAFATGITGILTFLAMLENGFMIGALVAIVQPTGHLVTTWAGLLPHGVCELSAIFIDGAAGFLLFWALISPGEYTRRDALIVAGRDAVRMVAGTVPLFIVAGIIEGNVSHSSLPHALKFTFAALQFAALVFYIYGSKIKSLSEARP